MAKQTINVGTGPNTGTGEAVRTAFIKVNDNFTEVYGIAQGAYNYANTIISDTQVDPVARPTANAAFDAANAASSLAQNAFDAANNASVGANTGNITFANATISAGNNDEVIVQAKDAQSFATARLNLEPEYSTAKLSAFSSESVETFTLANGDFATGVWQNNGFGIGVVSFTGAQNIGDFFQNILQNLTPDNVSITINSEPAFPWNGSTSGSGTNTPGLNNTPTVPPSPVTITSISFTYRQESYISVNYDNQEIRLDAQSAGIRMDASQSIEIYGDDDINFQAEGYIRLDADYDVEIESGSTYAVRISGGDFSVNASDDVDIRGNDSFRLRNESNTAPIRIITDDDNNEYTWAFNANGVLQTPGNIDIDGTIFSQTAIVGKEGIDLLYLNSAPNPNTYLHLDNITNALLAANANVVITSAANTYEWIFDNTGTIRLPGNISLSNSGCTSSEIITVPNSSGDGEGATTLELVPDVSLKSSDRFVIIDPTDPTHVHIRAGGTIDNSQADLYLGGETSHVRIASGENPDVFITANNYTWAFYDDGELNAPGLINAESLSISGEAKFTKIVENYAPLSNATGVVEHDCSNGHIFKHTNLGANFTANFTNLGLDNGEATSITLILEQGGTPYIANNVQIGGGATTIKWSANTVPTGNANAVDVQSFSIYNVGNSYTVLGQLSTFG